jgi:NAD(P)H-hydrate repair Nnr-like enzyme with NAD(P)H-hydrate dehydratase domain
MNRKRNEKMALTNGGSDWQVDAAHKAGVAAVRVGEVDVMVTTDTSGAIVRTVCMSWRCASIEGRCEHEAAVFSNNNN